MDLTELLWSFKYIEGVRSYAYNKGKKRLIKKKKLADLYFAGAYILSLIKKHGTKENKAEIEKIIELYKDKLK